MRIISIEHPGYARTVHFDEALGEVTLKADGTLMLFGADDDPLWAVELTPADVLQLRTELREKGGA